MLRDAPDQLRFQHEIVVSQRAGGCFPFRFPGCDHRKAIDQSPSPPVYELLTKTLQAVLLGQLAKQTGRHFRIALMIGRQAFSPERPRPARQGQRGTAACNVRADNGSSDQTPTRFQGSCLPVTPPGSSAKCCRTIAPPTHPTVPTIPPLPPSTRNRFSPFALPFSGGPHR